MGQFCNTEPRLTKTELANIMLVYQSFANENEFEFGNPAKLTKYHFAQIIRVVDKKLPNKNYKNKLERWLQIKAHIWPAQQIGSKKIALQMKIMFDAIADTFIKDFKKMFKKHNIPKLDLICLVLLYNISIDALQEYGWYFLNKEILLQTKCIQQNWFTVKLLLHRTNERFICCSHMHTDKTVRDKTLQLFTQQHFLFEKPSLQCLIDIALNDSHGYGEDLLNFVLLDDYINKLSKLYFVILFFLWTHYHHKLKLPKIKL
jgi:hypothetical protein